MTLVDCSRCLRSLLGHLSLLMLLVAFVSDASMSDRDTGAIESSPLPGRCSTFLLHARCRHNKTNNA